MNIMKHTEYPSYTVAIRTLGTAGEKYLETLRSCDCQIIKPEKILVYIPHGYALPKETIGKEEYIRCDKGMVTQRSLPFDEIKSEYILFLDDDLSFQEDFVKLLFAGLAEYNGDCISPDIYANHKEKLSYKIRNYFGGTKPHFKKDWAFIIRQDGHYSYNNNPAKATLLTQSGAGACALCKTNVYKAIHFEDERWLEKVSYALGDDQLFFYKMYVCGFKILTNYNAKIIHLDAGVGRVRDHIKLAETAAFCRSVIWHRTIYSIHKSILCKISCILAFTLAILCSLPLDFLVAIKHRTLSICLHQWIGYHKGFCFIRSKKYKAIPQFTRYINQ